VKPIIGTLAWLVHPVEPVAGTLAWLVHTDGGAYHRHAGLAGPHGGACRRLVHTVVQETLTIVHVGFLGQLFDIRPDKVGLKCTSVRPQSFFDFNDIWCVGRGR